MEGGVNDLSQCGCITATRVSYSSDADVRGGRCCRPVLSSGAPHPCFSYLSCPSWDPLGSSNQTANVFRKVDLSPWALTLTGPFTQLTILSTYCVPGSRHCWEHSSDQDCAGYGRVYGKPVRLSDLTFKKIPLAVLWRRMHPGLQWLRGTRRR